MKYFYSIILITFSSLNFLAQETNHSSIAFYNVENLFDTIDDPHHNDNEFLPESKRSWNSKKYYEKINHINQVIEAMNFPIIVGLCEIENASVVRDIVNNGTMNGKYGIIHFESKDHRGIDNAIIYDSTLLTVISSGIIRFDMPEPASPSRDIVWAKFKKGNTEFITMVNHWPSRWGGQLKSEPKRLVAAYAAKEFIDSVQNTDPKMNIIFMGDLNDYPTNKAPKIIQEELKPMINESSGKFAGTHNYRGEWGILDHIMITSSFTKKSDLYIEKKSGKINDFDFLVTTYKEKQVPFRTYGGGKYLGGYSDHFPVSVGVIIR